MIPARRLWLAALAASFVSPHITFAARSPAKAEPLRVARRWATGNARLVPPTLIVGQALVAGDQRLGLFDLDAAAPRWLHEHKLPEGAAFRPRHSNAITVCGGRRELGAWQLADGKPLWRRAAALQIGTPCLHGNTLYFGDGHELIALDLASGHEHWRFAAIEDTQISYAPSATDDTVFVGPGDGRLYALDAANGQPRWTLERMADWQYLRQLHLAGNILIAGSYKEKLHGIDSATGKQLWEFSAGNFINSHHVSDGAAYLWSPTGWLYAIDAASGNVRWRHRTTNYRGDPRNWASLLAELTTHHNRLYALDLGNVLHVLDTSDGREIARLSAPEALAAFVAPAGTRGVLLGTAKGDLLLGTT